jgi:hypothetical protein
MDNIKTISDTKFQNGNSGKPKGAKNKRTVLKENIGIDNWQSLEHYLNSNGLDRLINELNTLTGKDFIQCYTKLLEYFKPKQRALNANISNVEPLRIDKITFS